MKVVRRDQRSPSVTANPAAMVPTTAKVMTKKRIGAPTTHNMPMRIAPKTRAVPRSRPATTRPVARNMPGTTGTTSWCRLSRRRSLLA